MVVIQECGTGFLLPRPHFGELKRHISLNATGFAVLAPEGNAVKDFTRSLARGRSRSFSPQTSPRLKQRGQLAGRSAVDGNRVPSDSHLDRKS